MSVWAIPYVDQDLSFWEEISARFGDHIREIYCPLPGGIAANGRPPQPERFLETFLQCAPLPKSVLINPIVLPGPVEAVAPAVIAALEKARDKFGVRRATVASLTLARLIKEALPDFSLSASILMGISRPAQALMVQDYMDCIVPDNTLLRDLRGLKRLRQAYAGEIRLIVNEACIPGCLYRTQHFYEMGYSPTFPESLCQQMLEEHPWLRLTGAWILPRHLVHYEGLYDSLKLAGRVTLRDRARYLAVLNAYIHRESLLPRDLGGGPASVRAALDMPDELFEFILKCDKRCSTCTVCRDFYEQWTVNLEGNSNE